MYRYRSLVVAGAVAVAVGCGGKSEEHFADASLSREATRPAGAGSPGGYLTPAERSGSWVSPTATPAATTTATLSAAEREFVHKAQMSNQMEVALGHLAAERASNAEVKKLADRIAADHQQASGQLQQMVGSGADATAPGMGESDPVRQRLEALRGADFDRAYLEEMVKHHQQDISEFERALQSMNDPLRTFAEKTLPTLRQHLELSRQLQQRLGRGNR